MLLRVPNYSTNFKKHNKLLLSTLTEVSLSLFGFLGDAFHFKFGEVIKSFKIIKKSTLKKTVKSTIAQQDQQVN